MAEDTNLKFSVQIDRKWY